MFILQSLPVKIRDEVNENIEGYNNYPLNYSRDAQKKIMNAINRTYDKYRHNNFSQMFEIIKD
jgi:hypothetical protein